MSDSDSDDLSTPADLPTNNQIELCLRRIVRAAIKGDEVITVKLARTRAEEELGLETGFLKDNDEWKQRSKEIINNAVEEPASPELPKESAAKPKSRAHKATTAGTKRKSDEGQPAKKKRQKKDEPVEDSEDEVEPVNGDVKDESDNEEDDHDSKIQTKSAEESALSSPPEDDPEPQAPKPNGKPAAEQDDESDLSSVIDDQPPKKKRQKKSTSPSATKSKSDKSSKAKPPNKDLGSDEEEIKRLQSWLLKCGVRKLWHRELASCSTNKEKIKHLKAMLDDVGMTGRFSAEKARSIKEVRELKAELEAATEFNEQWGHEDEEGDEGEKEESGRGAKRGGGGEVKQPARRAKPKGLVDFGDSDEESD